MLKKKVSKPSGCFWAVQISFVVAVVCSEKGTSVGSEFDQLKNPDRNINIACFQHSLKRKKALISQIWSNCPAIHIYTSPADFQFTHFACIFSPLHRKLFQHKMVLLCYVFFSSIFFLLLLQKYKNEYHHGPEMLLGTRNTCSIGVWWQQEFSHRKKGFRGLCKIPAHHYTMCKTAFRV